MYYTDSLAQFAIRVLPGRLKQIPTRLASISNHVLHGWCYLLNFFKRCADKVRLAINLLDRARLQA